MEQNLYLALVHHPIRNKRDQVVTTSVTNLDIHDISRSCRTFGVAKYFIVTPLEAQHGLVQRILGHWERDRQSAYNPDRQRALNIAQLARSVDEVREKIVEWEGKQPLLAVTGANFKAADGEARDLKEKMQIDKLPCLLLFGTGWGLHASLVDRADFRLGPIYGAAEDGYNHLSVRSAVAIYLDRFSAGL